MSKFINTEQTGPSVREVAIFGTNVFPNTVWNWPEVELPKLTMIEIEEINYWCNSNIGYTDYFYRNGFWYFTHNEDAILFRLTWL
jgi:hypothetical protein